MWPEFDYSVTMRTLIENFLEHENRKWFRMQMWFLWTLLLVCACGWMTDTEINFLFIFFGFGQLYFFGRIFIVQAMCNRFQNKRFLLGTIEEEQFKRYLKKIGIPEEWLAEELEIMSAKCMANKK